MAAADQAQHEHLPRIFVRFHGIAALADRAVAGCLDGWLVYWHLSGQVAITHAGKRLLCDSRQILIRSPHCQIQRQVLKPAQALWFHLHLGLPIDQVRDFCAVLTIDPALQAQCAALVRDVQQGQLALSGGFAARLRFQAVLCQILTLVPEHVWPHHQADVRLADVLRYMEDHCRMRHDNRELAQRVGLSTNAFIRLFSQCLGMSPQRYLMKLRLEEAAQLLVASTASIDAIAEQLDFIDRSHFSRRFKQHFGLTPTQLRERQVLVV